MAADTDDDGLLTDDKAPHTVVGASWSSSTPTICAIFELYRGRFRLSASHMSFHSAVSRDGVFGIDCLGEVQAIWWLHALVTNVCPLPLMVVAFGVHIGSRA